MSKALTLALAAILLLPAGMASAELSTVPTTLAGPPSGQPVKAECWQQGVKILDQTGLWNVNLGTLLHDQAVLLQSHPEGSPDFMIIAVGQATCVVRHQPGSQ